MRGLRISYEQARARQVLPLCRHEGLFLPPAPHHADHRTACRGLLSSTVRRRIHLNLISAVFIITFIGAYSITTSIVSFPRDRYNDVW